MFIAFPKPLSISHPFAPPPATAVPRRDFPRKPALRVFQAACLLLFLGFLLPSGAQAQTSDCSLFQVTGLDVSAYSGKSGPSMLILWRRLDASTEPEISSYIVRWGTSESTASEVRVGRVNSYILGKNSGEDLAWDTTYMVWVRAERSAGEDCWSEAEEVTTPSLQPSNPAPSSSAPSSLPPAIPADGGGDVVVCPDYAPATTAEDVESARNPDTLADFVKEARAGVELLLDGETDQEEAMRKLAECFGAEGDWNHGSAYLFSIVDDGRYFLAPGETGPAGTYLDLVDENGCDVAAEIIRAARGETLLCDDLGLLPEGDAGGFVQYLWDSPSDSADDSDAGNEAPGSSPKLSYVEGITNEELLPGGLIILGSGYYPEISVPEPGGETSGSGGGCALVAATDARNGAAMGLFLSTLALGCAVFLGRGVFPRRG